MTIESWLLFVATCLVASMTPGPGILAVVAHSIQHGIQKAMYLMLGILTGLLLLAVAAISGLGILLESSETLFSWLQYVGAAYLFYIGIMTFLSKGSINLGTSPNISAPSNTKLYCQGIGVSLVNPKSIGFFSVLFLPFINPNESVGIQFLILISTLLGCSIFAMFFYAISAKLASPLLKRSGSLLNKITGGTFMVMASVLVIPNRS